MPVFAPADLEAYFVAATAYFFDTQNGIFYHQPLHIAGEKNIAATTEEKRRLNAGAECFPQLLHRVYFGKSGGAGGQTKGVVRQQRNLGCNRHG